MRLDQPTLEVILMIVNLFSFLVMLALWRINSDEKGPEIWVIAAGMGTAAFFVMIFYGAIGNYAIFLNNFGSLAVYLLILEGILRFRGVGKPEQRKILILCLMIVFLIASYANRDYPAVRYLVYDTFSVIILMLSAVFILYRTRKLETAIHSIAACSFLLLAAAFSYRWYLAFSGNIESVLLGSTQHPFQAILFMIGVPFTIGWTYGLVIAMVYRAHRKLIDIASRDELTGLANRRNMIQYMNRLTQESGLKDGQFLLLLLDINGFKEVNDSNGHAFGDKILCHVAGVIEGSIRDNDYAVRYGGDEFVIIMGYQDGLNKDLMIERIRSAVELKKIIIGWQVQLRVSIGTALYPIDGLTMDELILKADSRMYEEKRRRQLNTEVLKSPLVLNINPKSS